MRRRRVEGGPGLVVILGKRVVQRVPLGVEALLIGSTEDADIRLQDRGVQSRHAEIQACPEGVILRPLGEQAVVLIGGERIREQVLLHSGQQVNLGLYTLRVEGVETGEVGPLHDELGKLELRVAGAPLRRFDLHDGARIGRGVGCWIPLDDLSVSPEHALFYRAQDGRIWLRDLASRTGTRVNGQPIEDQALRAEDEISIGPFIFTFLLNGGSKESVRVASWSARVALALSLVLVVAAASRLLDRQLTQSSTPTLSMVQEALSEGRADTARGLLVQLMSGNEALDRSRWGILAARILAGEAAQQGRQALAAGDALGALDPLVRAHRIDPRDQSILRDLRVALTQAKPTFSAPETPPRPAPEPAASEILTGAPPPERPEAVPPPAPPKLRLLGSAQVRARPGQQLSFAVVAAETERRSLSYSWEADNGSVDPLGPSCAYLAPREALADQVRVIAQSPDGGRRMLTITVSVSDSLTRWDAAAEELFWQGYRLLREERIRDLSAARAALERALAVQGDNDEHPLVRSARKLLTEIDQIERDDSTEER